VKRLYSFCIFFLAILALSAFFGSGTRLHAGQPLSLDGGEGYYRLEPYLEILPDPQGELDIQDVSSIGFEDRFEPLKGNDILLLKKSPVYWARFWISETNQTEILHSPSKWLLEVAPSFAVILNSVDVYLPQAGSKPGTFKKIISGAQQIQPPEEIASRKFLFTLPPDLSRNQYCYVRLESRFEVLVNFNVWSSLAYFRHSLLYFSAYGIIYGILIGMILYNFFIYVSLRDRAYLYYILYIAFSLLWQFWVQGHAKMVFGQQPDLDLTLVWVFVGALSFWAALFTLSFLEIKTKIRWMYPVFLVLAGLGAATIAFGLLRLHVVAFNISHLVGILLPVACVVGAFIRVRQGFGSAKYYLLAWSLLILAGLGFALMGLKILPVNFITVNGVAIGAAMESILLSLALAYRIRELQREKEFYRERQRRYHELSITDGLTGLFNKRYLMSKLSGEVEHAHRVQQPLALLIMDLDDFKKVNDDYGHAVGDTLLVALGIIIRDCVRDIDVACRFGGEEFTVILPGTGVKNAVQVAERIRQKFSEQRFSEGDSDTFSCTVSLGAAELIRDESSEQLLDRADKALYQAKRAGKNQTIMAD
jgi:diguanylate cyclase (GGDEF)-like protein